MKKILLPIIVAWSILVLTRAAYAQPADLEEEYNSLRQSYVDLKSDAIKKKYRENWSRIGNSLIELANANKESPFAPRALFTAAELYRDLRKITISPSDLDLSIDLYGRVESEYPDSNLADDALYWKALLQKDVKGDEAGSCKTLSLLLARHGSGDMAAKAKTLYADCPAAESPAMHPAAAVAPDSGRQPAAKAQATAQVPPPRPPDTKPEPAPAAKPPAAEEKSPQKTPEPPSQVSVEQAESPKAPVIPPAASSEPTKTAQPEVHAPQAAQPQPANDKAPPMIVAMKDGMKAKIKDGSIKEGIPLSEQLGLKFKRIVIDPGHGGEDTGAIGKKKVKEKDVTLAIAKKLAKKLRDELKVEVVMTRTEDQTVSLPERTALARAVKADLFVSIHANANPNRKFRGIETYYLNNTDDRAAQKVAAMENASLEAGLSDLRMTLLDLALSANVDDSIRLANLIQRNAVETMRQKYADMKDHGVKYALFYVLFGTEVPSVLIETSFISNPTEEQRLKDPRYQEQLANGIYQGIKKYIGDRTVSARYR